VVKAARDNNAITTSLNNAYVPRCCQLEAKI
jgi:hypothetical protein